MYASNFSFSSFSNCYRFPLITLRYFLEKGVMIDFCLVMNRKWTWRVEVDSTIRMRSLLAAVRAIVFLMGSLVFSRTTSYSPTMPTGATINSSTLAVLVNSSVTFLKSQSLYVI